MSPGFGDMGYTDLRMSRMDRRTSLEHHAERNRKLLELFRQKGVGLDEPRSIEVHFWARSQPHAVGLAQKLYEQAFTILLLSPARAPNEDCDLWNIKAGWRASIVRAISAEFTATLVDLALGFQAEYDGWGTSV